MSWSVGIAVLLQSDEQATLQEWQGAVDAALKDPAFRPGMGVVHDMRRLIRVPTRRAGEDVGYEAVLGEWASRPR